jgi:hypothetical protein
MRTTRLNYNYMLGAAVSLTWVLVAMKVLAAGVTAVLPLALSCIPLLVMWGVILIVKPKAADLPRWAVFAGTIVITAFLGFLVI